MAFTRGKTTRSTEWIRKAVERVLINEEVRTKLNAIQRLQDKRLIDFDLSRELTTWACMAFSPHQGRPAFLDEYWARGTGKTWKVLKEFPERLERIADEVERFNGADPHFFARRKGSNDLSRSALVRLQKNCMQLPTMIRDYAKALRERNAAVAAATPRSGSSNALIQLTETVKFMTGNYHDREVSEFLNTVADMLDGSKQFDAISIAQVRSRRKKKT